MRKRMWCLLVFGVWGVMAEAQVGGISVDATIESIFFGIQSGGKLEVQVLFLPLPVVTYECQGTVFESIEAAQNAGFLPEQCFEVVSAHSHPGRIAVLESNVESLLDVLVQAMRMGWPVHLVVEDTFGGAFIRHVSVSSLKLRQAQLPRGKLNEWRGPVEELR